MIVDKDSAAVLTVRDWPTLVDIKTGVVMEDVDEESGLDLIFMKNPASLGDDSMVSISHSVAALRDGNMIFSASLESLDLRALSSALGESVKSLQNEYGIKGYFTPSRIILYGNGEKEDLGVYLGAKDDDSVFDFLRGLFEDSFVEVGEDEDYSDWIIEE